MSPLCDPKDCSLPGSSVHEIFQARILEWLAISFSRGSSWPRDQTQVSCIAGGFFTTKPLKAILVDTEGLWSVGVYHLTCWCQSEAVGLGQHEELLSSVVRCRLWCSLSMELSWVRPDWQGSISWGCTEKRTFIVQNIHFLRQVWSHAWSAPQHSSLSGGHHPSH